MNLDMVIVSKEDFSISARVPLTDEVIRIMCLQMDISTGLSKCEIEESGEAIHEIRKYFKKLRAIIRLVKNALGPQAYEQENTHYRNMGQLLAPVRDSAVYIGCWAMLPEESGQMSLLESVFNNMGQSLATAHEQMVNQLLVKENRLHLVSQGINSAKERLLKTPGFAPTVQILKQGLNDTFCEGKTAMQKARIDLTIENLHEWRKQTKYLMYQMDNIRNISHGLPEALYFDLDKLSDVLGDDHDYAELAKELEKHMEVFQYQEYVNKVREIIEGVRKAKQDSAWPVGERIFNESENVILSCLN